MIAKNIRQFIVQWNNDFPLDKWWRDKYKIPFGSETHLQANQVDILFEYVEFQLYEEHTETIAERAKKLLALEKEGWIKSRVDEMSDEDFDKIEI